nr:MAG TPA: hypothetical protein [Caudoviricetes sp.]
MTATNVPTSQLKKPRKAFRLALYSATTAVYSNAKREMTMNRITVRIDDLINQLNELKRDGVEKVLLEIEEGVADPEENCPNRINLMPAYHPSEIFSQVYESY